MLYFFKCIFIQALMKRALTHLLMQNLSLGEHDSSKTTRKAELLSKQCDKRMLIMGWVLFVHNKTCMHPSQSYIFSYIYACISRS